MVGRHFYIIPFDTHSEAILLPIAILKKFQIFFRTIHLYFSEKFQILTFLRTFNNLVTLYGKLSNFSNIQKV